MAPSDRQSRSREDAPASGSTVASPKSVLDEGPTSITKQLTRLERTQRTLRLLSSKIAQNNLLNATRGVDPTRFVLGVVSSMSGAQKRIFQGAPITLIETNQPQYIELPRKEGRPQSPIMASFFLFGDKSPSALASDAMLSQFVHDSCLEFAPLQEGEKPRYLIPVESGIQTALAKATSNAPPKKEDFSDLSAFLQYLPFTLKAARAILVKPEVHDGAPLDLDKIHDLLDEGTLVQFEGEQKKTTLPFTILKLEGGAAFRLYPLGNHPPIKASPQGCETIFSGGTYYLVMPEIVARQMDHQHMSECLSP